MCHFFELVVSNRDLFVSEVQRACRAMTNPIRIFVIHLIVCPFYPVYPFSSVYPFYSVYPFIRFIRLCQNLPTQLTCLIVQVGFFARFWKSAACEWQMTWFIVTNRPFRGIRHYYKIFLIYIRRIYHELRFLFTKVHIRGPCYLRWCPAMVQISSANAFSSDSFIYWHCRDETCVFVEALPFLQH